MYRRNLLSSIAVSALCITTFASETVAAQEQLNYNIPAQDLSVALRKFAKTSKLQVIFDGETARGKRSTPITNHNSPDAALRELLNGTGLTYQRNGKIYIISAAQTSSLTSPHLPSTLASAAAVQVQAQAPTPQYDEIIVTAQKKEERITDVPIAMSAFSAEALDNYKIEGGSELLRAVPNVAFSKTNFASYNFSIRGVGTKALSASTDPAVAISFNNVPLIRNRLFEQEYFDVNRVEVLRGPQGTLYGRNATGGVVNMLPNLPSFGEFEGNIKGEVGSFKSKRISGMLNVPLMDDLSIRIAGAMTKRDGYDFNEYTNNKVNGRDLYSIRTSALWSPNEKFRVTEHFSEDDNRSRTGKQLCHHDAGPESVGSQIIRDTPLARGYLSQGWLPGSIYEDAAFGVPNGLSMQQVQAAAPFSIGYGSDGIVYLINSNVDPYAGVTQSRNLRVINTQIDPIFRSKNNVFQINLEHEISDNFKFFSQSLYTDDYYYSNQDYNRFISNDIFNNSRNLNDFFGNPNPWREGFTPDGVLSDPQLGDSKKMVAMDLVNSKSSQYYQEFRVNSSLEGFFNFNIGLNYTKFKVDEDYYVFNNMFTVISKGLLGAYFAGREPTQCETILITIIVFMLIRIL